jgi:RNA polymerase sigma-70 factor (ECF subfamily)
LQSSRVGVQRDLKPQASGPASAASADAAALLTRVVDRDARALEQLYDGFAPVVCALAVRICGNRADADEITQEVFWKLWCHADRFDPERGSVVTWLLTIARNAALDRVRARAMRRSVAALIAREHRDRSQPAAEVGHARWLREGLAALPASQRHALELAYFAGLSHSEIARRIGAPIGTVKSRISQALNKLRHRLVATPPSRRALVRREAVCEREAPERAENAATRAGGLTTR